MNTRIYPRNLIQKEIKKYSNVSMLLEISTTKSLIIGKRYYFDKIDRKIHMIYNLPFSILAGKQSEINKFNLNRLILRPIVRKNNEIVGTVMSFNNDIVNYFLQKW